MVSLVVAFGSLLLALRAEASGPGRVVVVPLDDASMSRGLDAEAARLLRPTGMVVLQGEDLQSWIGKRREPAPRAETLELFAPATQTIAEGVERFFYKSPERALPSLEPVLDLAWHHPEVLAYRPDLADQIWQAGIVLVRAYLATDGREMALRQAIRLLTLLPTRETDPKIVPPDTRDVLEAARERIALGGATVRLSAPDAGRCTLYLNGARAEAQRTYVVDPSGKYFARADCSEPSPPPVWRIAVEQHRDAEFLVPPTEPQNHRSTEPLDDRGRRIAEWYLQATAALTDADVAVGVASPSPDDAVVLVRYDRKTQVITWSDDDYADSIRRGMPRIFPEYAALFDNGRPAIATTARRRADWLGVGSVVGGLAVSGLGTYLVVNARSQRRLLDCAVNNPAAGREVDCSDERSDIFFDDFAGESKKVNLARAGGYVFVGVGAAAVGFGIYRLLRPRRPESTYLWSPMGIEVVW